VAMVGKENIVQGPSRTWKKLDSNRFLHVLFKKKGSHF
jgi:hypothetical protein